jgi:hypothetical protein
MKNLVIRAKFNYLTIIENVFVIIMLIVIVLVSIPSFRGKYKTGISREFSRFTGWIPHQLDVSDDKALYCQQDILMTMEAKIIGYIASNLGESFHFPLPDFPRFPYGSLPAKGAMQVVDSLPPTKLDGNGYFENMTIRGTLEIDTGHKNEIRKLIVDHLELGPSGTIHLLGNGKLLLFVRNTFIFQGTSTINAGGSPDSLILYYKGLEPLRLGEGTQIFVGSIYTETADFNLEKGNLTLQGNIIVGGTNVQIENANTSLINCLLYAPLANLVLTGESKIEGKIVAKSITGSGTSVLQYKPVDIAPDFIWKN